MQDLYQKYRALVAHTHFQSKRYLYDKILWNERLIGIVGARGVGKTTLMIQHIKDGTGIEKAFYTSADDMYFTSNTLTELADTFYNNGGEYLFIDKIHKYENWSQELNTIYDSFPTLKIIFAGSSVLEINYPDELKNKSTIYNLEGFSFREYLNLVHGQEIEIVSFENILKHNYKLDGIGNPSTLFKEYLHHGYYPFTTNQEFPRILGEAIINSIEIDIPQFANLTIGTSRKLKRLLSIISENTPFKPNASKISQLLGISRVSLDDYFQYIEQAGLIIQLRNKGKDSENTGKVNSVYLNNTNLAYNLISDPDINNIRETFFLNQMSRNHQVTASKEPGFTIDNYKFEISGRNKTNTPLDTYIVKDNIEYGFMKTIPLWAFGLNY